MTEKPVITEIIGIDDWLIFGQDAQGVVYYTICEVWGIWLDAPYGGVAEYGTSEHTADWRFVIEWTKENKSELSWQLSYDSDELHNPGTLTESEMAGIRQNMEKVLNA